MKVGGSRYGSSWKEMEGDGSRSKWESVEVDTYIISRYGNRWKPAQVGGSRDRSQWK